MGRMCLALPRAPALNLDNRQGLIVAVDLLACLSPKRGVRSLLFRPPPPRSSPSLGFAVEQARLCMCSARAREL